ncbi:P-loop containing nucleoside triphosphate hydrolase protein [Aspergillus nidulans var. acristatus]
MSTPTVMNTLTTTTSEEHAVLITKGVTEPKSVVRNSSAPILERVNSIGIPVLYIRSRILLDALGALVSFQSSPDVLTSKRGWRSRDISSSLEDGRIVYPFTDLYNYRQRLLGYREEVKETHDPEYSETCREHIDVLDRYLLEEPPIDLNKLEVMLHQTNPKVTFASICFLLKPGSDVYVREHGNLAAYVSLARVYRVYVWNLNFDGRVLTRSVKKVTIAVFDGEREIRELPVFPAEHYSDDDPQRPLRQQLIERGRHFVQMMRKPALREYSGPSRLQGIREYNRARVVIDHTGQPWNLRQVPCEEQEETDIYIPVTYEESVTLGERTRVPRCTCDACRANDLHAHSVQRRQFDDYEDIDLASTEELTDHQYMLCGPLVYGFVLKDRVWDVLDVSRLQAPQIQKNIIDMLVMRPESNKQMIKAICEIYGGSYAQPYSSDFIHGKGEGQILLLHGPPGTGKTLTAESVAEYTGRPLLSLTAADLGQEPETLEESLLRFFRDAKKWNAVVILDEADVYLEARSTHDLGRNSIVSIFLRALDYFQGILFLTTNRVGSFDEAFMSRIHVQIGYDPLDDESRQQIWENHFKKLTPKEYIRKSKELQSLKWNGREIRNAFQTAVALACYQAKQEGDGIPEITDIHFRRVVAMSQNFKSYLRSFQPDVASVAFLRNDKVKAAGSSLD